MKNKNPLPSIDIKHEFTVCIDAFDVFTDRVSFNIFKAVKSNVHVWALSKWCTLPVFLEENTNSSSQERSQLNVTFPLRLMVCENALMQKWKLSNSSKEGDRDNLWPSNFMHEGSWSSIRGGSRIFLKKGEGAEAPLRNYHFNCHFYGVYNIKSPTSSHVLLRHQ